MVLRMPTNAVDFLDLKQISAEEVENNSHKKDRETAIEEGDAVHSYEAGIVYEYGERSDVRPKEDVGGRVELVIFGNGLFGKIYTTEDDKGSEVRWKEIYGDNYKDMAKNMLKNFIDERNDKYSGSQG